MITVVIDPALAKLTGAGAFTLTTTCPGCGATFSPTFPDLAAGTWHRCPACRSTAKGPITNE